MTIEEEYENQQSWRTSPDKLTFIICEPIATEPPTLTITAKKEDADEHMVGDVNFFFYPDEEDGDDAESDALIGEVDVMIAAKKHRGKGYGEAAVRSLLLYIQTHLDDILQEYAQGGSKKALRALMVKIQEGNQGSRGLFTKLGFRQVGEVNYFGEVKLMLDWEGGVKGRDESWVAAGAEYKEMPYQGLS